MNKQKNKNTERTKQEKKNTERTKKKRTRKDEHEADDVVCLYMSFKKN